MLLYCRFFQQGTRCPITKEAISRPSTKTMTIVHAIALRCITELGGMSRVTDLTSTASTTVGTIIRMVKAYSGQLGRERTTRCSSPK